MKKITLFILIIISVSAVFGQNKNKEVSNKSLEQKIVKMENENQYLKNNYNNLIVQYQQTNDRLNNYLTFTGIIAAVFGVFIALSGIYIGFESLRSQNRAKEAIKTLEDAKDYVNNKKAEFDTLIEGKKQLLQGEYDKITQLLKDKLLNDIELETSKIKEIAEKKTEEIQNYSVDNQNNKTMELLEKRLEFFENVSIPDDPEILFSKSKILREKNMHKEAILLLEKLTNKVPEHVEAFWYLGYEYAEIGESDLSIKNYKKQIELNPTDGTAHNNIALRYKAKNNLLEALDHLNKAVEISNKKEIYYTNRIDILKKLNSNERAIEDYRILISLNPDKISFYNEIIMLLKIEERNDEVVIFFDKAINHFKGIELKTANDFSASKASFFGEIGKEQEAIDILQTLIDDNHNVERCYANIADLKNKLGKTEEAISILTGGISTNPLSSILYIYKAYIESDSDENKSKLTIDQGGLAINSEHYYFNGGRFFTQKGKHDLATYFYEGAFKIIVLKLEAEKIEEGDIMNYYEASIILNKQPENFEEKYRKLITTEKYLTILSVLDNLKNLVMNYSEEAKSRAILEIKNLNIEAKDKDLLKWDFKDIKSFVEKQKNAELTKTTNNLIKYIQKEITFQELQAGLSS